MHAGESERLTPPVSDADIRALALLLIDAVESGAAVSFLAPLSLERAEAWWRETLGTAGDRSIFIVARSAGTIVGSVQLHPAWAPNQPHRADVVKLLVHRDHRRAGIGAQLVRAIEAAASQAGFRLLTLDAKSGGDAERLYARMGWARAGRIPAYAVDTDGRTPHDTTLFFKHLGTTHPAATDRGTNDAVVRVRPMRADELPAVEAMMRALWPGAGDYDFGNEHVLVWQRADRTLGGFISFSLRPWAEGCESTPVPYVEGWWVAEDLRRTGVGRALMTAVESWCRERGYTELGSDVELANDISHRAHAALGFEPVERVQFYRKRLR